MRGTCNVCCARLLCFLLQRTLQKPVLQAPKARVFPGLVLWTWESSRLPHYPFFLLPPPLFWNCLPEFLLPSDVSHLKGRAMIEGYMVLPPISVCRFPRTC